MNYLTVSFVCIFVCFIFANGLLTNKSEKIVGGGRIVHGINHSSDGADVSLQYTSTGRHFCGATLVTKHHFVTSANCLLKDGHFLKPEELRGLAGTASLSSGGARYAIEAVHTHPQFNRTDLSFNIAVLRTKELVTVGRPEKLPTSDQADDEGRSIYMYGFGGTSANSSISDHLQFYHFYVTSYDRCKAFLELYHSPFAFERWAQFCVYNRTSGSGLCNGDYGSLGMVNGFAGIASYGGPCMNGYPNVYTNVYYYKSWIASHLN